MALKKRILFIVGILLVFVFSTCDNSPSDPEPEESDFPSSVDITAPSSNTTYWDDEPVACAANPSDYADKTTWSVGDEEVSCTDEELDAELAEGEHTVTARIEEDGESIEKSVTITVKEGFSVTLESPKSDAEYFVGDEVSCEADVEPDKYADALQITVGGVDCTDGSAKVVESGELTARAWVTVDNRTESDELTVRAKQAIAGAVYPLTDRGITSGAGFTVTLKSGGNSAQVQTAADGSFSLKPEFASQLGSEEVTLEVSETGDFYGSKAVLPADELLALVEAQSLGFILAPRNWQIRCGPMAGKSTTIKLPEAFKRYDSERQYSSFYMYFNVFGESMYRKLLPEDRPLPVAFDREDSEVAITAADSTSFWQETEEVEKKICRGDLLAPTTIDEVPTIDDGVQVRAKSTDGRPTGAAVTNDYGHINGGSIGLPIDDFGPSYGQRHEIAQVLGFGETSEWVGVMSSGSFSGDADITKYSVDDISHIQLYMDTADLQHEEDISFGVYEWRRVFNITSLPDN